MANSKVMNVVFTDCPYCDGENIVGSVRSDRSELDLTDREIACKHCHSVFTLSESKTRVRSLPKRERDVA